MTKLYKYLVERVRRARVLAAFGIGVAVMPLAACDTNTNLAQIAATIQQTCGFVTSYQNLVPIVVSLIGTFDAGAGAAATVATATATQIIQEVCGAVQVAKASGKAPAPMAADARVKAGAPETLTVVVNGVPVNGTLVGSK
jgi:hypothetical protein